MRALMRRPTTWAAVAGAGLFVALCLPFTWPGWMFWGAMALSCAGAAAWGALVTLGPRDSDHASDDAHERQ